MAVLQVSASADRGHGFSECLFGPAVIAKKLDGEGFQRLKFKMTLCIGSMGYVRCRKGVWIIRHVWKIGRSLYYIKVSFCMLNIDGCRANNTARLCCLQMELCRGSIYKRKDHRRSFYKDVCMSLLAVVAVPDFKSHYCCNDASLNFVTCESWSLCLCKYLKLSDEV